MTQAKGRDGDRRASAVKSNAIRFLVVEDHPLMRQAIVDLIKREWNSAACDEAGDEVLAMQLFERNRPQLVTLDLSLGDRNGLEFLKWAAKTAPEVPILVLSMYEEMYYAERVIRAGGRGYLNKRASPTTIVAAMRTVLNGDYYLHRATASRILQHLRGDVSNPVSWGIEKLSDREMETFESIGEGLGSREIAERLYLSVKTVEAYRQRIKEKLGISTSPELARRAVEWVLSRSA
ncbi:MAG: response regulator transcription factor [Phycisphaerae bacterium]